MDLENAAVRTETVPLHSQQPGEAAAAIAATAPGEFRAIRRNGKVTAFDGNKIKVALTKAFLAVEGSNAAASTRIHNLVEELAQQIVAAVTRRMPSGGATLRRRRGRSSVRSSRRIHRTSSLCRGRWA